MNLLIITTFDEDEPFDEIGVKYKFVSDQGNKLKAVSFMDGDPEDNSLCRGFSDVYDIPDLIKIAHAAGLNGEILTVEHVREDC